ncbi:MAG: Mrp/NBP35 family ATP-binding protein [Bdellovibrionota bacterium]|nr:MAG: Mrp/NBP35 family ATP-binding protein [Bdellovibrionota bacterium]
MAMRHIVPVVSGKGGVGKSTLAVNLAVGLGLTGARVALVDSDFYGPSIPTLMGGGEVIADHEGQLVPPLKHGIKYVSLGFFLRNPDDAVIWRGPMFNKALQQLFQDVNWGEIDYCIVDMPPGTGDAQISLTQMLRLSGAVVVTTPQEVALADVRKAISMLDRVKVPVLGIVENMSAYIQPDGQQIPIFGKDGGKHLAEKLGVPLLAQIPIDISVREGGDNGMPVVLDGNSNVGKVYRELALKLKSILDTSSQTDSEVRIVN